MGLLHLGIFAVVGVIGVKMDGIAVVMTNGVIREVKVAVCMTLDGRLLSQRYSKPTGIDQPRSVVDPPNHIWSQFLDKPFLLFLLLLRWSTFHVT